MPRGQTLLRTHSLHSLQNPWQHWDSESCISVIKPGRNIPFSLLVSTIYSLILWSPQTWQEQEAPCPLSIGLATLHLMTLILSYHYLSLSRGLGKGLALLFIRKLPTAFLWETNSPGWWGGQKRGKESCVNWAQVGTPKNPETVWGGRAGDCVAQGLHNHAGISAHMELGGFCAVHQVCILGSGYAQDPPGPQVGWTR